MVTITKAEILRRRQVHARLIARESADAARLADVVEREAMTDIAKVVTKPLTEAGHARPAARAAIAEEQNRVVAIIAGDQAYRAREHYRKMAEMELAEGVFVNLTDTVVEPTPEWLTKGDVASFTPQLPDGHIRSVKTVRSVRRMSSSVIVRLRIKGDITDDQYAACQWYRDRHEIAGLEGRWSTSRFSNTPGGGSGGGASPMASHEREAQARAEYRAAQEALTPFYRKFFEKVVVEDIPLHRAARFARCRKERALYRLRSTIQELIAYCESRKVELDETDRD